MGEPQASSLAGLKEIGLPPATPWWPQTAGWYVLFALVAAGILWVLFRWARSWWRNRYRSAALAELARIEQGWQKGEATLQEIPELVKRTALQAAPRAEVAALSGDEWLRYLDRSYGGDGFTQGPGRMLCSLAYRPVPAGLRQESNDLRNLFGLVASWIRHHHARV